MTETKRCETDDGRLRWWRPDVIYALARDQQRVSGAKHAALVTALAVALGPLVNSIPSEPHHYDHDLSAARAAEKRRVKRRERWRIEARRECERENE